MRKIIATYVQKDKYSNKKKDCHLEYRDKNIVLQSKLPQLPIQRQNAKCRTKIHIQQIHTQIQTIPCKRHKKCNNTANAQGNRIKPNKNTQHSTKPTKTKCNISIRIKLNTKNR